MTKGTALTLPEGFVSFWKVYPRRQSKGDALKAWNQQGFETIAEEVVAAVKKYPFSEDPKYIKLPATFIRSWCHLDEFGSSDGGEDNDW